MKTISRFLLLLCAPFLALASQTTVSDNVNVTQGLSVTSISIAWPAFTATDGTVLSASSTSASVSANGAFTVSLYPSINTGVVYTVTYNLVNSNTKTDYWTVPVSTGSVNIKQCHLVSESAALAGQAANASGGSSASIASTASVLKGNNAGAAVAAVAGTDYQSAIIYNAKDSGATGNGSTIDTPALQTALNLAESSGGTVYLPCGTYMTNATLTVYSNTVVAGEGPCALIKWVNPNKQSMTANCASGSTSCTVSSGTGFAVGQTVIVSDSTGMGHATGNAATIATVTGVSGGTISFTPATVQAYTTANSAFILIGGPTLKTPNPSSNVKFQDFALVGGAIYGDTAYYTFNAAMATLNFCTDCVMDHLYGTYSLAEAFMVNTATYNQITNSYASSNNGNGIHLSATSTHVNVSGNTLNNNLTGGITFSDNDYAQTISNNHMFGNGTGINGIDNSGTGGGGTGDIQNTIFGNTIENSVNDGLTCNNTNNLLISNNVVLNNGTGGGGTGQRGIYINNCNNVSVIGNLANDTQVSHTQKYGILESGTSDSNIYIGNQAAGNTTLQISVGPQASGGAHSIELDVQTPQFSLPNVAGFTALATKNFGLDTTANNWHGWTGADSILPSVSGSWTNGDCASLSVSGSKLAISDASSPCATAASTALPYFITGGGVVSNSLGMPTASASKVYGFLLSNPISTSKINVDINTADNTANLYDVGIYNSTGTLVLHIGATAGTTFSPSTGFKQFSWLSSATLQPGKYYIGVTSNCASACAAIFASSNSMATFAAGATGGATTGGTLNSSFGVTDVVAASNIPVLVLQ